MTILIPLQLEESEAQYDRIAKYEKKIEDKRVQVKEMEELLANGVQIVPLEDLENQLKETIAHIEQLEKEIEAANASKSKPVS